MEKNISHTNGGLTNEAFREDEDLDIESERQKAQDYETTKKKSQPDCMLYGIDDEPAWYLSLLLGLQHYLTMVGSTVAIPLIITPLMCIAEDDPVKGRFVSTILFVSGLVTFMQTTIGVRLPIVQGGTFSFLVPTFTILATSFPACSDMDLESKTDLEREEVWKIRIREVQGSIILACLFQVVVSSTGLLGFLLKWITPLAITPTITLIGLSLFVEAAEKSSGNWAIAIMTVVLLIIFSQYLVNIEVPIVHYSKEKGFTFTYYPLFKTFPILIGICVAWGLCGIFTAAGVFSETSLARTDLRNNLVKEAPWVFVPYPFQYGIPTISVASVFGMMAGVIASMIESVGDYYACARICDVPIPPAHAVNRGIFIEGCGGIIAGIMGTGNGTTSYSQNIGALRITRVGSRRVVQAGGLLMIGFGILGKFGAFCATIPDPLIGGLLTIMFSIITAVGLSNLQMIDLNSSRNLFVLGFSIFFGISFPMWVKNHPGSLLTGFETFDQVAKVLFSTPMFIGGLLGFFLDNTVPGTREERGLDKWNCQMKPSEEDSKVSAYDLPFGMEAIRKLAWLRHVPISPTYTKR